MASSMDDNPPTPTLHHPDDDPEHPYPMGNPLPKDDDTLPTDAPLVMPDAEQPGIEPDMVIIPL